MDDTMESSHENLGNHFFRAWRTFSVKDQMVSFALQAISFYLFIYDYARVSIVARKLSSFCSKKGRPSCSEWGLLFSVWHRL